MSSFPGGLAVAAGLAVAGWFIGQGFIEGRASDRIVTVKGLAERDVDADLAVWRLPFVATSYDLARAQRDITSAHDTVMAFLLEGGLSQSAISIQVQTVEDRQANAYQSGNTSNRFIVKRVLLVRTTKVDTVQNLSQKTGELVEKGVVLGADRGPEALQPTYSFTGLNDIKTEMISEATKKGIVAAEQFARDAGAELGRLMGARQGVFQILARDQAPQLREAQQRKKTVRVVSTFRFELL
ncbi:MAG: SIMPL domain-containing protein [Myxococcota bacterium]